MPTNNTVARCTVTFGGPKSTFACPQNALRGGYRVYAGYTHFLHKQRRVMSRTWRCGGPKGMSNDAGSLESLLLSFTNFGGGTANYSLLSSLFRRTDISANVIKRMVTLQRVTITGHHFVHCVFFATSSTM